MFDIFSMPFFLRVIAVLFATGLSFPVLGTFILHLELVPVRFAVMHAALLGTAVALIFNLNGMVLAMLASIIAGVGIARISWRGKVSAGGSLGLIMTVCMGLAFIIFYKGNVHANEAFSIFWGNILTLGSSDTNIAILVSAIILLFLFAAYKEIHIVLYDRNLAQVSGIPTSLIYGGILLVVCLGIAVAMRVTGALLIDAVTILPAFAARRLGKSFKALILWGAFFGVIMNLGGFVLSLVLDLPVSSAIVLVGILIILIVYCSEFVKRNV